jgi:hypothetical protein
MPVVVISGGLKTVIEVALTHLFTSLDNYDDMEEINHESIEILKKAYNTMVISN